MYGIFMMFWGDIGRPLRYKHGNNNSRLFNTLITVFIAIAYNAREATFTAFLFVLYKYTQNILKSLVGGLCCATSNYRGGHCIINVKNGKNHLVLLDKTNIL